jgi:hypothetical protein
VTAVAIPAKVRPADAALPLTDAVGVMVHVPLAGSEYGAVLPPATLVYTTLFWPACENVRVVVRFDGKPRTVTDATLPAKV